MKKIDQLVLRAFWGIFFLTLGSSLFLLLMQFCLVSLDELVGKDLGVGVYAQLVAYVVIIATKQALPLAILLGGMMSLGNLGVHGELTALKGAGVSMPRVLRPLFFLACLLFLHFLQFNFPRECH